MSKKSKKNKVVVKVYKQPIYGIRQLVVIISNDMGYIYKTVQPCDKDYDLTRWAGCDGLTIENVTYKDEPAVCIYLHPEQFSDPVDNVSCHESIHAMFTILSNARVDPSSSSEEAFAYLGGWINQCVKETYNQWLKK